MPLDERKLFETLGSYGEKLDQAARNDEEIKLAIKARGVGADAQHLETLLKISDLAEDMRQIPQLRRDLTDWHREQLELAEMVAANRARIEVLEKFRDGQIALTINERVTGLEGWRDGQKKWLWLGRILFAAVIGLALALAWLLQQYAAVRDFLKAPHP